MALLLNESLYPASFRGARFWYQAGDTTAGRKTVIHEYPKKDFRFVEDLGRNLRMFSVQAIIKGGLYLIDKKRLEDALNIPEIGLLVHPFYGNISVYPIGYTVNESITSVGVANFTLNFAEAEENFSPRVTGNNTSIIANIYRDLYNKINEAINLEWTLRFVRNIQDAAQAIQRVIDRLNALSRISNSIATNKSTFADNTKSFSKSRFSDATNPANLADNFTNTISSFDNISDDYETLFDINNKSFGLGSDDTFQDAFSGETIERNKNKKLLNGTYNYLMLNNLYNASTQLTYEDEIKLNNTQNTLNSNFNDLITNPNYLLNNDLIYNITKLRNESGKFFDNLRLTVSKVTTIKTQKIPTAVLSYQYYKSTDNYNEILSLNNITNPAVISGDIKILEQQPQ